MKTHSKPILALVLLSLAVAAFVTPSSRPVQAAGTWYVAPPPAGSDGNDCLTPSTPCATINGAIEKAAAGDTIKVAVGTYTASNGPQVVLINKSMMLSGGWNTDFSMQSGKSTIDAGGVRRGITLSSSVSVVVERFVVQNGFTGGDNGGGVFIDYSVNLTFTNGAIIGNKTWNNGGGVYVSNGGTLTLDSSAVSSNNSSAVSYSNGFGGGIYNWSGIVTIINSVVSNNIADGLGIGGGIYNHYGTVSISNTVVSGNSAGAGGGGIRSEGSLPPVAINIKGSAISNNSTNGPGGGIFTESPLTVVNSTISSNRASGGGGVYSGLASMNNVTITGNSAYNGGGIYAWGDEAVSLRNSILAGNRGPASSPDCSGTLESHGYNLIQSTVGCTVSGDLTGNIIGTDPLLFPLLGSPGFHAVRPGSPAIDAGNPTGCTDSLGSSLATDQRGTARPLDGDGNGNAICDIGAFEFNLANPITVTQVFLPLTTRDYCPNFFDDFSNPASGWPGGEDDLVRVEYLGGEYRVLSKNGDYIYLFRSPACARQNYTVEMDARWVGATGNSYGLLFGITSGFSQYYMFDLNTDYQMFRLYRRDPSGFTQIAPITYSSAIRSGTSSNHLKVTRSGSQITLSVNGALLGVGIWFDGAITGSTWVGLMSSPYSNVPVSDARFDNFLVTTIQASGAAVETSSQDSVTAQANGPAVTILSVLAPPALEWKLPDENVKQQPR